MPNSKISNENKTKQLGMNHSTARAKLMKMIMFDLVKKLNLDTCYQCGNPIGTVEELSIEHKHPWLHTENPVEKYFDLENIAFSHLSCNSSNARRLSEIRDNLHLKMKLKTSMATHSRKVSSTGYKNVYHHHSKSYPFRVRIKENNKYVSFGVFKNVEDAVIEADKQLLRIYGEDAVTNKMLGLIHY